MQKVFNPRCVDFYSFLAVGAMRWYQGWFLPLSNKFGKEIVVFPCKMPCNGYYGAVWFPKDLLAGLGCFFPFSPDLISPKNPAEGRRCWAWQSPFEEEMLSLTVFFFFFKILLSFPDSLRFGWNQVVVVLFSNLSHSKYCSCFQEICLFYGTTHMYACIHTAFGFKAIFNPFSL